MLERSRLESLQRVVVPERQPGWGTSKAAPKKAASPPKRGKKGKGKGVREPTPE